MEYSLEFWDSTNSRRRTAESFAVQRDGIGCAWQQISCSRNANKIQMLTHPSNDQMPPHHYILTTDDAEWQQKTVKGRLCMMRKVASACTALSKLTIRSSSIPKINMVLKSVEKANRAAKGVIRRRTSADAIVHWMCQRGELLLFTLIFCLEFRQLMKMQTGRRRKKDWIFLQKW